MKINYNGKEVGKWYHNDAVIPKAYINDNMVFPRMPDSAPPTPEYDVMCSGSISDYTGNAPEVFCFSVNKWYMRTIGGNYTEYGIYATGKPQDPYIGELAIDGGHEWEYTSNGWVDLGETSRLPQGYTELEYIEAKQTSNYRNNSYLVVDFKVNQDTRILCSMQRVTSSHYARLFGSGAYNAVNAMQIDYEQGATGSLHVSWGAVAGWTTYNVYGDYNKHEYDINKNVISIDGVEIGSTTYANFQCTDNLGIFTEKQPNMDATNFEYYWGKMFYFKVFDNGTLALDLVPAKRDNDSVAGAYDVVNKVFYTSETAVNFTAGPVAESSGGGIVKEYSEKIAPPIPVECCQYEIYTGSTISTYEGAYPQVYILDSKKWYMRTTLGNYKEYGIYANQLSNDAYVGELAIYDGHEYEYTASGWVDLGAAQEGDQIIFVNSKSNSDYLFECGHYWNNGYKMVIDCYYYKNYGSDYGGLIYYSQGHSLIEFSCYSNGFYFDWHNPTSTSSNSTYTGDYSNRNIQQNVNFPKDGTRLKITLKANGNVTIENYETGQVYHTSGNIQTGFSFYDGLYVTGKRFENINNPSAVHSISVYDNNDNLVNDLVFMLDNGVVVCKDKVTNTVYNNSGSQTVPYDSEGSEPVYPEYYDTKAAPTTAITASTVEELESITCGLFEGMKATVGSDTYSYTNGEWVKLEFTVSGLTKSRTAKTVRINNTDVPIEIGTDPNSDNLYEWYAVYSNKITSLYQFLYNTYNDVVSVGFNEDIDIDQNTSVGMFAYNRSELTSIKWPKGIINLADSMLNNTKITEFVLNDVDMTIPQSYFSINFPSTLTLFDSYNSRVATTNNAYFVFPNVATCSIGKNIIPPNTSSNVFGKMNTVTIHPENPIYKLSQDGKTIMADGTNNGAVWDKVAYKAVQGITAIPDGVKTLHNYYGQYISINNDITVPQSVTSIENNYALAFETQAFRILLPYYRGILSTSTLYSNIKLDFHNNPYFPYDTGVSGSYGNSWRLYMNGTVVNSFSDNTNNSIKLDRCTSLTTITLSENVNATCSFVKSTNLATVNIPKTESYGKINVQESELLTTVNNAAGGYPNCYACYRLRNIDLSKATKITNSAFMNTCLGEVTLSGNLTEIEDNGFQTDYGISMILHMQSVVPPTLGYHNNFTKLPITFVPSGSLNAYKTATNWIKIADRIFEEGTFNANDYSTIEIKDTGQIATIYNYLNGVNYIYFYPYSYDSQKGTIKCAYTNVKSTDTTLAQQFNVYNYREIVSVDLGRNNYFTTVGPGMFGTQNSTQIPYLESIVLPPNLTTIKSYTFGYSFNGSSYHPVVNLPDTITTIEQSAFREYKGNINKIPPLVTTIPSNCFWGCQYLNFDFSTSNITSIDNYGFGYSNVQTEVYFPDTLTTIGGYNLYQYNAITKVRLGPNVTSIGQAFLFCGNNVSYDVVCEATTPPTLSASQSFNRLVNLYVPDASVDTYKGASGWTSYSAKIKPISEMPVS